MELHSFEISCWFKSEKFMVCVTRDRKGKVTMRPKSFMGHGEGSDVFLKPDELDEFNAFLKEARETFEKSCTVNQEILDKEEEKDEIIGTRK